MRAAAVVKHNKSGPKRSGSIIVDADEYGRFTKGQTEKGAVQGTELTYSNARGGEKIERSYYEHSAKRTAELYKKHKQAILARNRTLYGRGPN